MTTSKTLLHYWTGDGYSYRLMVLLFISMYIYIIYICTYMLRVHVLPPFVSDLWKVLWQLAAETDGSQVGPSASGSERLGLYRDNGKEHGSYHNGL